MSPSNNSELTPERQNFVRGLREMATFLEQHPDIPCSEIHTGTWVYTKADLAKVARQGSWQKVYTDSWFSLKKVFTGGHELNIYANRDEVCKRVVVGTRMEPARPATPEREVEVVEWRCEEEGALLDAAVTLAGGQVVTDGQ